MAIDWTDYPANAGYTGRIQFKVDADGTVHNRGSMTLVVAPVVFPVPVAINPISAVNYLDWTGASPGLNTYIVKNGNIGFASGAGFGVGQVLDISPLTWKTSPPPANPHTLEGVRTGTGDALRTIAGLRVYDFPSDRVEPPAAVLSLPETPYDVTFGSRTDEWVFPLWILVAKADDKSAYGEMVDYLEAEGSKSIRAIIEADRTLGGACDTVAVTHARPLFATVAGTEFLAVEFTLEVYT